MTTHLRAHSAWRQAECPGSTKFVDEARELYGDPDIPEAQAGADLHKLVDEVLSGAVALDEVKGGSAQFVARCIEFIERHGYQGETETLFTLEEEGELVARCRADYVAKLEGAVMVVDWKFYHEPLEKPEAEWQMLVTVTAAAMALGETRGYAKLYLPILDITYEYEVPDAAAAYRERILPAWRAAKEAAQLRTGPWCARCAVLGRCPAASQAMETIARGANLGAIWHAGDLPTVKHMTETFYEGMKNWSPSRLRGVVEWLPVVPAFEAAVKQILREELRTNPASFPGWQLSTKNLPAEPKSADDQKALEAGASEWLSREEIEGVKKLSVAQLRDRITEKLVEGGFFPTKKAAGIAAEQFIEPFVNRPMTTELRRVKL